MDHGIRHNAADSAYGFKVGVRVQSQFRSTISLEDGAGQSVQSQSQTSLRRARLMLTGYIWKKKVTYFFNMQFDRWESQISDAIIRWHPDQHHTLGFGQFRVFDDRQFRISSAYLQLVERSVVSNSFSNRYNFGGYWQGSWVPENRYGVKFYVSATQERWKNRPHNVGGWLYTARAEYLPFGAFEGQGDYHGGGFTFQPAPKLSLALAGSFDDDTYLAYSGLPNNISADIHSLFADFLFKYRHFSMMGEWAQRAVGQEIREQTGGTMAPVSLFSGYGLMLQAGNMISRSVELNARYEAMRPEDDSEIERIPFSPQNRYTLGTTWYLHSHSLKMQAAITLVDEIGSWQKNRQRYLDSRLQFQLNF